MPWSNSVSRRYSSPTCTLEIRLKPEIWSFWTGQFVRKHIRFQLIFDDPHSSSEKPLIISGDVLTLEELYQTVKQYSEAFFHGDFGKRIPKLAPSSAGGNPTPTSMATQFLLEDSLESRFPSGSKVLQPPLVNQEVPSILTLNQNSSIQIKPQGSFTHQLDLGVLATEASNQTIQLGNLQLLDLVAALEECMVDLMAIAPPQPPLKPVSGHLLKLILGAIAFLVLGLTAATTTKIDRQPAPPPLTQPTIPTIRHSQSK